jgi:predicted DNA-binding transcriptional regulator AlpA
MTMQSHFLSGIAPTPTVSLDGDTDTDRLLTKTQVRRHFGNVSDKTIDRWVADEDLNFPKPAFIKTRLYWREAEILNWQRARFLTRYAA